MGSRAAFEFAWPSARCAGLAWAEVDLATGPSVSVLAAPVDGPDDRGGTDVEASRDSTASARGPAVDRIELSAGELYGLPEARGFLARGTLGSSAGSATLTIGQLGGELYREKLVGVTLARPLGQALVVEVGGRLLSVGARGVDERTAMAFDAGLVSRVLGRVVIAAGWRNIGDARIGGSPVSAGGVLGAALVLDGVSLAASLDLDRGLGATVAAGCEAAVSEWLRVRAGVALEPGTFGAGIGIGRKPGRGHGTGTRRRGGLIARPVVDFAVTWHPDLGGSSFATVSLCR